MSLIREITKIGYNNKIYCGYFIGTRKIGNNTIDLDKWYRPLNLNNLNTAGFTLPKSKNAKNDKTDIRSQLKYKTPWNSQYQIVRVTSENLDESLQYYQKEIEKKKFSYYPDTNQWNTWTSSFKTYLVTKDNKIHGLFSLGPIEVAIPETKIILSFATLLLYTGNSIVFQAAVYQASLEEYDLLYGYIYGDITQEVVEHHHGFLMGSICFSLYNNNSILSKEDLSVPIW
jgi:hypothetical protein